MANSIPVGISNRHFHLSKEHVVVLFGPGYALKKYRTISQTGQFAAEETLDVQGPKGTVERIRVVGPLRGQTQLEIAPSDAHRLGIKPPVRYSGDLDGSAGATLIGPRGRVELPEGIIIPQRHIHMSPSDARQVGVYDRARVIVRALAEKSFSPLNEPRDVVFDNVLIRVDPLFVLDFHLDVDEANASGLKNGDRVEITGFSSYNKHAKHSGLITERDVREAIRAKHKIYLDERCIITPAAKDIARAHDVFRRS